MAIAYDGINYFPIGVNFMEENAMEVIEAKYGIKGSAIVLKLLCKIYKEGYYIRWDEEQCLIFANKAGREVQAEEVKGIIEILFIKGILDENSYQENEILTSESIQKVWMEDSASLPIPGYAFNTMTHNYPGLTDTLQRLGINEVSEVNAILRLSDYGRKGTKVWRLIANTCWSDIGAKGRYLIAALNKAKRR